MTDSGRTAEPPSSPALGGPAAVLVATLVVSVFVIVGADTYWAVALGHDLLAAGAVPRGVPFLVTARPDWPNPLVLGEVLLALVDRVPHGLAVLQVGLVAAVLATVASQAGRLARSAVVPVALTVVGSAPVLVIGRLPSLSLVPFAVLTALLRREHELPSRRLWLAVPLLALWSNLHGGFLVGLALLGVHLLVSRLRREPLVALLVGAAAVLATCANPAGLRTVGYVLGVFGNEAARRGTDLWARPDLTAPLDVALLVVLVALVVLAVRARLPRWEAVAAAGLVAATLLTARNGAWLVLLLAPWAGRRLPAGAMVRPRLLAAAAATAWLLGAGVVGVRGGASDPAGHDLAEPLVALAAGRPVLAGEPLAESVAAAGGRVWGSNPVDAMEPAAQASFLDFLHEGRLPPDLPREVVVAVSRGGVADSRLARDPVWRAAARVGGLVVYERAG